MKLGKRFYLVSSLGGQKGRMAAVERSRDGFRTRWFYDAPTSLLSAPQLSEETILFGGADGFIYGIGVR